MRAMPGNKSLKKKREKRVRLSRKNILTKWLCILFSLTLSCSNNHVSPTQCLQAFPQTENTLYFIVTSSLNTPGLVTLLKLGFSRVFIAPSKCLEGDADKKQSQGTEQMPAWGVAPNLQEVSVMDHCRRWESQKAGGRLCLAKSEVKR